MTAESLMPSPGRGEPNWLGRCALGCALVPMAAAFLVAVARDRGPVWRANYHSGPDWSGAPHQAFERKLEHTWDPQHTDVPGALDARSFSARYDACVWFDRSIELPFMLVSDGVAQLRVDGRVVLDVRGEAERHTRGAAVRLEPGWHHLHVDFSARRWPSIGLYASFEGRAPAALPPDDPSAGVEFARPGAAGCGERSE